MVPLNLANSVTLLRILAVPVVVVALLGETPYGDTLAAIVFALAAATDGLDGYFARSRDAVTDFGKLMDPLADKLLIVAALVTLVSLGRLPGRTTDLRRVTEAQTGDAVEHRGQGRNRSTGAHGGHASIERLGIRRSR